MNHRIYGRLAITNLKNNKKTYLPYGLISGFMVMMFYMIVALSKNKDFGDGNLQMILSMAVGVVILFAIIFLFYINSFLIKRRKKEIGVYHILGMGKNHLGKMLTLETIIISLSSILGGLLGGILFSRLMYLVLLKLLHYDIRMHFSISIQAIVETLILFVGIFTLTLVYNLFQIRLSNPIDLLKGGQKGEKEPKTKWFMTILGVVAIGVGYYIALTTKSPLSALTEFFFAVVCVMIGTYACFMAGSITLLKLMRKKKSFYYQTKHFTVISGMMYRMKQNAVGLANICMLSTMVLVMVSTTVSLYAGMQDVLHTRFPHEYEVSIYHASQKRMKIANQVIKEEAKKHHVGIKNLDEIRKAEFTCVRSKNRFLIDALDSNNGDDFASVFMLSEKEYNRKTGKNISLKDKEALLFVDTKDKYGMKHISIGTNTFAIKNELNTIFDKKKHGSGVYPEYYIVVKNETMIEEVLAQVYEKKPNADLRHVYDRITFDLEKNAQNTKLLKSINRRIQKEAGPAYCESRELNVKSFYMLYGSLFFIGIYLGVMFLIATVLIIYYKQISEGYDDRERYQIMQKVGMSENEVKSTIKSQVLMVFFLPLIVACAHVAVAFPAVTLLLKVLNLQNTTLFATCTIGTILVFALIYGIIYIATARQYYKMVSDVN